MDLAEVAAQRPQQTARAAADFERGVPALQAVELRLDVPHDLGSAGEKLLIVLAAARESGVVVRVFARALVPIGAHAVQKLGIVHPAVILAFMAIAFRRLTAPPISNLEAAAP